MEIMFSVIQYGVLGFIGLIGALVLLAVLFGKRIDEKWEYEAEFHDDEGREIGEFETKLSRIAREESDYTLSASLKLRHPALVTGHDIEVHIEGECIMRGPIETDGSVRLDSHHIVGEIKDPKGGQSCTIVWQHTELLKAALYRD